ncbi:hypothetical protein OESDEN_20850 [Oesophagostomum dentatum]|uniref:Uncharacterized protein n=1 Tax=Oesophagostomum dentatum TaxID=61180 RepID=A0A0B1S6I3_OESDE|nr:hypothetical protein OESDEN_20850 [Oesophagostomum dentatum]
MVLRSSPQLMFSLHEILTGREDVCFRYSATNRDHRHKRMPKSSVSFRRLTRRNFTEPGMFQKEHLVEWQRQRRIVDTEAGTSRQFDRSALAGYGSSLPAAAPDHSIYSQLQRQLKTEPDLDHKDSQLHQMTPTLPPSASSTQHSDYGASSSSAAKETVILTVNCRDEKPADGGGGTPQTEIHRTSGVM